MSQLKSDSQGFLLGSPAEWGNANNTWNLILDELKGLRRDVHAGSANVSVAVPSTRKRYSVAPPPEIAPAVAPKRRSANDSHAALQRGADGRFLPSATVTPSAPKPRSTVGPKSSPKPSAPVSTPDKDAAPKPHDSPSIALRAGQLVDHAPEIDPTIAGLKEVKSILSPIGRGMGRMFGTGAADDIWPKRIWKSLAGLVKTQSDFNKAALKVLENPPVKSSMFGGLANLLPGIPGIGPLFKLLGSVGGALLGPLLKLGGGLGKELFRSLGSLFGRGSAGGEGTGMLSKMLKVGGRASKGLLRRLPLIGTLFTAGMGIADAAGINDDPNLSPQENRKKRFEGGGSAVGSILGGVVGMLGGPIGSMIGSAIGDEVGKLVGDWLSALDWSKIGKQISDSWDRAVSLVTDTWKTVTDKLNDVATTIGDALKSVMDSVRAFVKNKFGIDIDVAADKTKTAVVGAASTANQFIKDKTGVDVAGALGKMGKIGVDAAKQVAGAFSPSARADELPAASSVPPPDRARYAVGALMKMGWTKEQAAGLAANLNIESGMRPGIVGDGGAAYGIAQWHPDRQAEFKRVFGHDIRGSSIDEQLQFVNYELRKGKLQGAGKALMGARTADEAGAIVSKRYEMPAAVDAEIAKRSSAAARLYASLGGGAAVAPMLAAAGSAPQFLTDALKWSGPATVASAPLTGLAPKFSMAAVPTVPPAPSVTPLFAMPDRQQAQAPTNQSTVSQDLSDRKIAHLVTGGLGGAVS